MTVNITTNTVGENLMLVLTQALTSKVSNLYTWSIHCKVVKTQPILGVVNFARDTRY